MTSVEVIFIFFHNNELQSTILSPAIGMENASCFMEIQNENTKRYEQS
jgi:hypothetical protein